MGFGLSGSTTLTSMDGADVTIAWVDNSRGANAMDYHLRYRFQVCCLAMLVNFNVHLHENIVYDTQMAFTVVFNEEN